MQSIINVLDTDKIFVLGAMVTNNEMEQKYIWLKENYPNIKRENIIFINSTMLKTRGNSRMVQSFNYR